MTEKQGKFKLLKPGDLEKKLSREEFNQLVKLASERESVDSFDGEEEITVKDAMNVLSSDLGISPATTETAVYDYLKGSYSVAGQISLSASVKSKAKALENRLVGLYNSSSINGFNAEEEMHLPNTLKGIIKFRTNVSEGKMTIQVHYYQDLFKIEIEKGPTKPKPLNNDWSPGWVAAVAFPPTNIAITTLFTGLTFMGGGDLDDYREYLHDVYVLPFKYAAYCVKKLVNMVGKIKAEPKVTISRGSKGKPQKIEEFLGEVVGNSDMNQYSAERFALKNLIPALERDIRQAQNYANSIEI